MVSRRRYHVLPTGVAHNDLQVPPTIECAGHVAKWQTQILSHFALQRTNHNSQRSLQRKKKFQVFATARRAVYPKTANSYVIDI